MHSVSVSELQARLVLHQLPHIGPSRFLQLLNRFGSAEQALKASTTEWQTLGFPQDSISARQAGNLHQTAEHSLRWLEHPQHHILLHDSPDYPALLAEIPTAPPVLFIEGNPQLLSRPQLAIIGSRHCSPYGEQLAWQFAKSIAASGCCITSGLALGIDSAAHKGALAGLGQTLAVVGTGLLKTYPSRNRGLRQQLIESGGSMVSELPLTAPPQASHFPRRNRIISGLSLGILVVEAGTSSGSLITARFAAEQGRDVFAIPGSIHHPGSKGCHQLIRDGAILVESVQDVLEEWRHWHGNPPLQQAQQTGSDSSAVLTLLQAGAMETEQLALRLQQPLDNLLAELTELEINGLIKQQAGLWFYQPA